MGREQVLARLQAIVRFTDDLERRFGEAGLGTTLGEVLGFYRKLKTALDAVPAIEIVRVMEETKALAQDLAVVERALTDLKRLKDLLGA